MIQIILRSFDKSILLRFTKQIYLIFNVVATPMPTKIKRFTVIRSPHVNKKSREQFEMRRHQRLLVFQEENLQFLTSILPAMIEMKIISKKKGA